MFFIKCISDYLCLRVAPQITNYFAAERRCRVLLRLLHARHGQRFAGLNAGQKHRRGTLVIVG